MLEIKDIKKQLPPYYKNDNYLNSFWNSCIKEFNGIEEDILFYRNLHSIIYCHENFLFLLEKEEGLLEVSIGLLKYLHNPMDLVPDDGHIKTENFDIAEYISYIDYTFKRRERLIAKNFIKVNTFSNINFRKMSSILGINYVSLKWDKDSGIVDVLVSRDEEIDEFNSLFIIQMIELWIPAHLKFGTIYSTILGQVVSDFKYEELETKIYRNIEELIYDREKVIEENGGIKLWQQYLQNS